MSKSRLLNIRSISFKDEGDDVHFSMTGCDICNNGLGNNVYDVEVAEFDGTEYDMEACFECISTIVNGD